MPFAIPKSAGIAVVAVLLIWSIVCGGPRLFAAEDPLADPLGDSLSEPVPPPGGAESVPAPLAEGESTPAEPLQSDCLGLLESGEGTYVEGDDQIGCDQCVEYGDWGEQGDCGAGVGSYWASQHSFYVRADYMLWWTRTARLPPLVTTSPVGAPPGVLGFDTTTVLFGDTLVHGGGRSNVRATLGYWGNGCRTWGFEGDYFDLGEQTASFDRMSAGDPVLARPYFDVVSGTESSQAIAYPGTAVGDVGVHASDYFASAGARLRVNLFRYDPCGPAGCGCDGCTSCEDAGYCDPCGCYDVDDAGGFRLDLIGGYRYYRLSDNVTVRENVVSTGPPQVPGTMFNVVDDFQAANEFNGGDLGMLAQFTRGRWSLELLAIMAMGNSHKVVTINGSSAITVPGFDTINYTGGLLALPTNIGHYSHDYFVIVPRFGVELGYQLGPRTRAFLGYNYLHWATVARAGDQIDLSVNPTQIPPGALVGEPRPRFEFRNSDFWAQGMNLGLEVRF